MGRPELEGLIGATSARLQALLRAAEHAATEIVEDAGKERERQLEGSRRRASEVMLEQARLLSELSDRLRAEAERTEHRVRSLLESLDDATAELRRAAASVEMPPDRDARATRPAAGVAEHSTGDPIESLRRLGGSGRREPEEGAVRLLATRMALAGSSREEIGERLREEFEIDDPGEILDGAFRLASGSAGERPPIGREGQEAR